MLGMITAAIVAIAAFLGALLGIEKFFSSSKIPKAVRRLFAGDTEGRLADLENRLTQVETCTKDLPAIKAALANLSEWNLKKIIDSAQYTIETRIAAGKEYVEEKHLNGAYRIKYEALCEEYAECVGCKIDENASLT